jgi:hypothetical protein
VTRGVHQPLFHGSINIAGNAFFGGIASSYLDWLLPVSFGIAAVIVVARSGWSLGRAGSLT